MNAILGFTELPGNSIQSDPDRNYLRAILSSGRTLLSLINDILDLSKIEAGKLELKPRPIDLRQVFDDIRNIFFWKISEKSLRVRVKTQLDLKRARDAERELIGKLQALLEQVKLISDLIPICFSCKKIRNDSGFWEQVEQYIEKHSEALFSHGICPDCLVKLYPEMAHEILARRQESPDSIQPEGEGPID